MGPRPILGHISEMGWLHHAGNSKANFEKCLHCRSVETRLTCYTLQWWLKSTKRTFHNLQLLLDQLDSVPRIRPWHFYIAGIIKSTRPSIHSQGEKTQTHEPHHLFNNHSIGAAFFPATDDKLSCEVQHKTHPDYFLCLPNFVLNNLSCVANRF